MTAARTLASGRKSRNWLAVALVASVALNIATPVYYSIQSKIKDQVLVFDLSSGSLLLSPMEPADSHDILTVCTNWAAKTILDRSPAGLDNDELLNVLFDADTARKARAEFSADKLQYEQKRLRSHVEIQSTDSQPIGSGLYTSRVVGQVIVTGTVNGESIQEIQHVVLNLKLARNPDLGRNAR